MRRRGKSLISEGSTSVIKKLPQEESYYVGRVGISDKDSEPVVIDWRAPVASIYYENSTGLCQYEVKNHGSLRGGPETETDV